MVNPLDFQDIQRFIDGTGRFRCDYNHCFYGSSDDEKHHATPFDVTVHCQISGKKPDAQFDGDIRYRDGMVLYDLAELAAPGVG